MGLLENFEKGLERVVNGAFAKTFRSGLQPVEIAAALKRQLDTKAAVVARDRVLAPNTFAVRISPDDHARMLELGPTLLAELTAALNRHAKDQRFQFAGPVSITLQPDPRLALGLVEVDSETVGGEVGWHPVLEIGGTKHPLDKARTILGRGAEADITLNDTGASRQHAEVQWDGRRGRVRDLGSTNGTLVDGVKVSDQVLEPGSVIQIGRTRIVFQVVAKSADSTSVRRGPNAGGGSTAASPDGFWGAG